MGLSDGVVSQVIDFPQPDGTIVRLTLDVTVLPDVTPVALADPSPITVKDGVTVVRSTDVKDKYGTVHSTPDSAWTISGGNTTIATVTVGGGHFSITGKKPGTVSFDLDVA